jgi:glycosyltransferase involved in cell wall biosynthesis
MKMTVCIASYNRADYLCEAIESVLNQTFPASEIVIYDNGSKLEVYDKISKYLSKGVRWVGSEKNNSAIWNFRRAINNTDSEFVMILHDDDKLCNDFIEKQISFLNKNPDIGAVSCNGHIINEKSLRTGAYVREGFVDKGPEIYESGLSVALKYASDSCIPFSPTVYRTNIIKQVDFRDEYSKVVDAVLFCDLASLGKLAYQSLPLYECRVHANQDSSVFSDEILNKLEIFFLNLSISSSAELNILRNLLKKQKTNRILHYVFSKKFNLKNLKLLVSIDFDFFVAISIVMLTIVKKIKRIFK